MNARRLLVAGFLFGACQAANGSDWMRQAEEACRRAGGTLTHHPTGGSSCNRPAGAPATSGTGGNPYAVLIEQGLQSLWAWEAQSDAASKQRSAAALQAIEIERQNALARQQTAYADSLAQIQRRLAAGMADGGLRPKLGRGDDAGPSQYGLPGRHVFRNDIFVGGNVDETEKIALTLKLGPDATASLRGTPAAAPAPATVGGQEQRQKNANDDILRIVESLTPEQQKSLATKLKEVTEGAAATAEPSPVAAPTREARAGDPQLSIKLAEAQKSADQLHADADDPSHTPEELKHRAGLQVTRPAVPVLRDPQPASPDGGAAMPGRSRPPAAVRRPESSNSVVTESGARRAPPSAPAPSLTAPTVASASGYRPSQSANPNLVLPRADDPFSFRPPADGELVALLQDAGPPQLAAERRRLAAELVMSTATLGASDGSPLGYRASSLQREALVAHFAPALLERYRTDKTWAAMVDADIDYSIYQARGLRSEADMAAWERSVKPTGDVMRRYTPQGQEPDVKALLLNPEFVKERERIAHELRQARIANAKDAALNLSLFLADSFSRLKP